MNVEIRELTSNESQLLKQAIELMNRTQGIGLFNINYLKSMIKSKSALVLGAFLGKELVGIGCAEIINNFSYYLPFDKNIESRLNKKKVGSLCSLCVRENLQSKGIGQMLSKKRIKWLETEKCNIILGVAWLSNLQHTSDRVFRKLGFKEIKEVVGFYKKDTEEHPFECPGCKKQPCICSARLYQLEIKL
ncbi:MAG: GNAT family N-acetyltransferase [Pseudomonadota bacterium]